MAYIYIISNKYNGTLYVGVTSHLIQRIYQHRCKLVPGFSKKYGLDKLVYFEECQDIKSAIIREKRLKKWNRAWKIGLIERNNRNWDDLYPEIIK
ncbi:MAG: GIY-YIG nuclease family protein [Patescibacteria group bacterium]|jgi:putative endonuclease